MNARQVSVISVDILRSLKETCAKYFLFTDPCANNGVCMDLVNGFKCECPRGYYDARCLSDVDECASSE